MLNGGNAMKYPRTVYLIRHNKTKRMYIGSSTNPAKMYESHKEKLLRYISELTEEEAKAFILFLDACHKKGDT